MIVDQPTQASVEPRFRVEGGGLFKDIGQPFNLGIQIGFPGVQPFSLQGKVQAATQPPAVANLPVVTAKEALFCPCPGPRSVFSPSMSPG